MSEEKKTRRIRLVLSEDNRCCVSCKRSLAYEPTQIYLAVPSAKKAYELCSWACLVKWTVTMLRNKLLLNRGRKENQLSILGYDFDGDGSSLPNREEDIKQFEENQSP